MANVGFTLKKVSHQQHTRMSMGGESVKIRFSTTNLLKNKERIVIVVKTLLYLMFWLSIRLLESGGGVLVKRFACGTGVGVPFLGSPLSLKSLGVSHFLVAIWLKIILHQPFATTLYCYKHIVILVFKSYAMPSSTEFTVIRLIPGPLTWKCTTSIFFTLRVDKRFYLPLT